MGQLVVAFCMISGIDDGRCIDRPFVGGQVLDVIHDGGVL
jgi:hypothetical protein